jgi:hypothetical protein
MSIVPEEGSILSNATNTHGNTIEGYNPLTGKKIYIYNN